MEGPPLEVKNMILNYKADIGITTSPYLGLEHRLLMKDNMISICRDKAVTIDLRKAMDNLILCRIARDSIAEQLAGDDINLSHCLIAQAASTQINMIENNNDIGIILLFLTLPVPHFRKILQIKRRYSIK